MTRSWEDNAREFGALSKQGYGVRLALLAACSVHEETKRGNVARDISRGRVTISEFADVAGVARSTVGQCLNKWDRMVEAGWDVPRSKLAPAMAQELDLPDGFVAEFEAMTEERPATRHLSQRGLTQAIQQDPKVAEAATAAVLANPKVAAQVVAQAMNSPEVVEQLDTDEVALQAHLASAAKQQTAAVEHARRADTPQGRDLDLPRHLQQTHTSAVRAQLKQAHHSLTIAWTTYHRAEPPLDEEHKAPVLADLDKLTEQIGRFRAEIAFDADEEFGRLLGGES